MKNEIIEGIRARHKSARPDATINPAWANAEVDINALLCVHDSLAAELDERMKANQQLAAIGQSQYDRIRELEGALRELRTCNETGCKLCFACLLHIERHVTPAEAPVRHAVTCKLFPDPFDERDPVGPCTCGATSETTGERLCKPLCAHGKHAWERCEACEMDGGTGFTNDRAGK